MKVRNVSVLDADHDHPIKFLSLSQVPVEQMKSWTDWSVNISRALTSSHGLPHRQALTNQKSQRLTCFNQLTNKVDVGFLDHFSSPRCQLIQLFDARRRRSLRFRKKSVKQLHNLR